MFELQKILENRGNLGEFNRFNELKCKKFFKLQTFLATYKFRNF